MGHSSFRSPLTFRPGTSSAPLLTRSRSGRQVRDGARRERGGLRYALPGVLAGRGRGL